MDKYEYKLKLEQIQNLFADGRYHQLEKGPQQHNAVHGWRDL